ncbi:hypothetical protein [Mesorhizobium sp.]|nr:hypothetical protein [Mesorhizobium sp.]
MAALIGPLGIEGNASTMETLSKPSPYIIILPARAGWAGMQTP